MRPTLTIAASSPKLGWDFGRFGKTIPSTVKWQNYALFAVLRSETPAIAVSIFLYKITK